MMTAKLRIVFRIAMILPIAMFAHGITLAKPGLNEVERQLNIAGIEVPDLLGPVDVWVDGEATLNAIMADSCLLDLYRAASTNHDFYFAVMLGSLILALLWVTPYTAWPKRMQAYPKLIDVAAFIGAMVFAADWTENRYANAYLDCGGSTMALALFQTASTIKWLLIAGSAVLILGVYARWIRQGLEHFRHWRNRPAT